MSTALSASAATSTGTMAVTATVIASCSVTANSLAFGNYDPVAVSALTGSTTISVTCTNGTPYVVSLDEGLGSGATVSARKMTSSGNLLTYCLYRDSGHSQVWGHTNSVDNVPGTGTGVAQTLNVYGLAPATQTAPVGAYSDTVTVTVAY